MNSSLIPIARMEIWINDQLETRFTYENVEVQETSNALYVSTKDAVMVFPWSNIKWMEVKEGARE